MDKEVTSLIEEAVRFAEASPEPPWRSWLRT